MITTTIYLGWSGHNSPAKESAFNKTIVNRLNRIMNGLEIYECSYHPSCALTIVCDSKFADEITEMAETLRMDAKMKVHVKKSISFLLKKYIYLK